MTLNYYLYIQMSFYQNVWLVNQRMYTMSNLDYVFKPQLYARKRAK